ncbi:FCD domain-containing protein [Pararhodobacter sp. SW119]|uniref:FadR/GntR family transcriptional regulator n=1 Tax=Pararhodobacter sp. SW119 TaxID=2780075 RepID=UPI001FD825A0|nr:FCD domain-containing protein [Pararhodobacter sp. SW119]
MTPANDNSSLALERLRTLLAEMPQNGEARLPTERALAETLGISRRSVRRAIEVLEAEGQVWRRQGSGTYAGPRPGALDAPPPQAINPIEVMEVRLRIEPQIAQLAALRARPEAIERISALVDRLDTTGDGDERELWDSALHREIARACDNRMFLMIFDAIDRARHDDQWRALRARARSTANFAIYQRQHRAIRDALAGRDPVAAGEAMRAHILTLNDNLHRQTSLEALPNVG